MIDLDEHQPQPGPPIAISKLNEDVLLEIFMFVGCQESGFYIHVLSISQVCMSWRHIALDSPTLWTTIYIWNLAQKSRAWQKELMRRTKQAPLSVYGYFNAPPDRKIVSLFKSIIRHEWYRIRKVALDASPGALTYLTSVDIQDLGQLMSKPAPQLSSFSVHLGRLRSGDNQENPPAPVFFHEDTQYLTEFISDHFYPALEECKYFTCLSRLSLSFPYTPPDLLKLLANIPSLRFLTLICHHVPTLIDQPLPFITPPNLQSILLTFYDRSFIPFINILDHIRPVQPISFFIDLKLGNPDSLFSMNISQIATFQRVLRTLYSSGFNYVAHDLHSMTVEISSGSVYVNSYCSLPTLPQGSHHWDFLFSAYAEYGRLSDAHRAQLLDLFSLCDFSATKSFSLPECDLITALSEDDPRTLFYRKFVSVEELTAKPSMITYFHRLNLSTVFPQLKTLRLDSEIMAGDRRDLLLLLQNWKPPTTMTKNLYLQQGVWENANLIFLDKVVNLRVTWKNGGEYLCGTGNPRILNFRTTWA